MSTNEETYITVILSPIAAICGYIGLTLTNVDLILAIVLKVVSIISVLLIVAVNWKKGIRQIKDWFKIK